MSENLDKRKFDRREYASILRLMNSSDDFKSVVAALERRHQQYLMDLQNADPDKSGKVGQLQGRCRELSDIIESVKGAQVVLNQPR